MELEECVLHPEDFHLQHICNHWTGFPVDLLISLPGSARLWQQQGEIQTLPNMPASDLQRDYLYYWDICSSNHPAHCKAWAQPLYGGQGGSCFCVLGLEETILNCHI